MQHESMGGLIARDPRNTKFLQFSVAVLVAASLMPCLAFAQSWANPQQALNWQSVRAPFTPGADAVAGGPGDSPEPNSPLFICRASVQGSLTPGKWVKGNCNVAYDGREVIARDYQIAYGRANWRSFGSRNDGGLIQTGNEANGTPLYSCRVRYSSFGKDLGYQPGKIVDDRKCDIAYGGREVVVGRPFEALYAGGPGTPATIGTTYPEHGQSHGMPLCKSSDPGVLMRGRTWSGPNCIPVDVMTNQPVPVAQPRSGESRPLCRKGDPGVTFTAVGYAGPNCVTTNVYGEVAAYGNATPEEKAHYRETMEPCTPGEAGVHVENGMLVGADCKSVPEPVAQTNKADDCTQSNFGIRNGNQITSGNSCVNNEQKAAEQKAAEEKAAADQRAAGEAEELRMAKEAEAKAEADKAAEEKAAMEQKAAEQKAAEEKAAADQRAAGEAEELRIAKEAEAKAEADKAAQEKAAQEQQAAEQKAAEEKAAADQRAAGEAEELRMAKEAEAKAAQEQADREKLEQLKKAFEDQAEKDKEATPASGSSS